MVRALLLFFVTVFVPVNGVWANGQPVDTCEVRFFGAVEPAEMATVVDSLQSAAQTCAEVTLIVESGGGEVETGWFYLHDLEELNLHTHVRRNAGSMAVPIFLAGDRRTIDEDGTLFLHNVLQIFVETSFDADDLRAIVAELEVLDEQYAEYIAERTGLSQIQVLEIMSEDKTLTAKEAVELGFAQAVAEE